MHMRFSGERTCVNVLVVTILTTLVFLKMKKGQHEITVLAMNIS